MQQLHCWELKICSCVFACVLGVILWMYAFQNYIRAPTCSKQTDLMSLLFQSVSSACGGIVQWPAGHQGCFGCKSADITAANQVSRSADASTFQQLCQAKRKQREAIQGSYNLNCCYCGIRRSLVANQSFSIVSDREHWERFTCECLCVKHSIGSLYDSEPLF